MSAREIPLALEKKTTTEKATENWSPHCAMLLFRFFFSLSLHAPSFITFYCLFIFIYCFLAFAHLQCTHTHSNTYGLAKWVWKERRNIIALQTNRTNNNNTTSTNLRYGTFLNCALAVICRCKKKIKLRVVAKFHFSLSAGMRGTSFK
jgi:hypothetical protein